MIWSRPDVRAVMSQSKRLPLPGRGKIKERMRIDVSRGRSGGSCREGKESLMAIREVDEICRVVRKRGSGEETWWMDRKSRERKRERVSEMTSRRLG